MYVRVIVVPFWRARERERMRKLARAGTAVLLAR